MKRAAIGFGGNLGRPDVAFAEALRSLDEDPKIGVLGVSGLYRSDPWGVENQPDFLNGAVLIETDRTPEELLEKLMAFEGDRGRKREERWGPRELDLDLLWYEGALSKEASLTLPHPRIAERTFVLEPLAEIDPAWCHPVTGLSAHEMSEKLTRTGRGTRCVRLEGARVGDVLETAPCPGGKDCRRK